MALNYSEYLQLERLLSAQTPRSPDEHDELLFIIVHQTYELWFKQLLHEGCHLRRSLLTASQAFDGLAILDRILAILRTLVKQTDILETMTPLSFASFRTKLEQSSGFQSQQFRMFEMFLGLKEPKRLAMFAEQPLALEALQAFMAAPSVYDALLHHIHKTSPYEMPDDVLRRDVSLTRAESDERIVMQIARIYREDTRLRLLCEKFVDLDEGVQEWRYRHVKMVERTIGAKMGSGGSSGVAYLRQSLFTPLFPELWSVRSLF